MDIVLVQPQIPHNSGCAGRLSAALGLPLHLVEPLGFSLNDRYLKRAGLDYWPLVDLTVHSDWETCWAALSEGSVRPMAERIRLFSARGGKNLFETSFETDAILVFGSESTGLPAELLNREDLRRVYVPIRAGVRSLNLANTVALGVYTAMDRAGLPMPANEGTYTPLPKTVTPTLPTDVARRD